MRGAVGIYQTSVGQKIVMAVTGIVLVVFVIGHMAGNLKVFFGQEAFDHYAHGLRTFGDPFLAHGQFLWIFRIVLLGAVGIHLLSAFLTWRRSRAATGAMRYRKKKSLSFSYASRTMRWGGIIIALFVIYHLLHLTLGSVHPDFTDSPYANVYVAFSNPWVSGAYVLAMIVLGFHLYHGIWSMTQTLDWDTPRLRDQWRPISAVLMVLVVAGFVAIPVGVLTGIVEEPSPSVAADAPAPATSGDVAAHFTSDVDPGSGTAAGSTH